MPQHEEVLMWPETTKDRIIEVILIVELTLILSGFLYYYVFLFRDQESCGAGRAIFVLQRLV